MFRADRDRKDYLQIYLIDVQGNNERQITNNDGINWAPYWYPNGKILAYTSSVNEHGQYEIYLLNINTKKNHQLTDRLLFDGLPVFNNDGTKLMWTSKKGRG